MGFSVRLRTILAAAASAALLGSPLGAQETSTGTVRGTVREAGTMRPVAAAQVSVPNTQRRVVTAQDGTYSIVVPAGTVQLRAERVGYSASTRSVTVTAGGSTEANFTLSTSAIALDAVVVTGTPGAATQREEIGNAVSSINAAEVVDKAPVSTVTQLLQGRAPGLTVMSPSGSVGTASNIRIRGTSSISAQGSVPVVVIDGIRMAAGSQTRWSVNGQGSSALDAINPEDIESIEVIKGPAAATLYGADAAAGVIQIITKKGKTGRQSLDWTAKVDYGQMDWALDMPTNYTLCTAARQSSKYLRPGGNANVAADSLFLWTGCQGVPVNSVITDQPLRREGISNGDAQNYTLSVRGGGERYSFFISGDREEENGIFVNNWFKRNTGRGNFFVAPSDKLNFTGTISFARTDSRLPLNDNASNGWLRNAFRGLAGNFREGSSFALGWRGLGPAEMRIHNSTLDVDRFIFGITTSYQPFSWLRHNIVAGLDASESRAEEFYPIDLTGRAPYGNVAATGAMYLIHPTSRIWTLDYNGTVTNRLSSDIESDLSVGMQLSARSARSLTAWCEGLISNQLTDCDQSANRQVFEGYSEQNSLGYYVQEQLGFRDRLFLTGAVRIDDNSAFGDEFNLVVYPKLQGSWVVSEEPFFAVGNMDNLRLRAAWGRAGNSPAPFSADRTFGGCTVVQVDNAGTESTASCIRAGVYGNPNLKAETGEEIELGWDASFLNGRVGAEFTYYNKRTYEALLPVPVKPSSGFGGSILSNVGTISNAGIELSLTGTPVQRGAFSWETQLVLSTNRNEFVSFNGARDEPIPVGYRESQMIKPGYPIAGYFTKMPVRNEDGTYRFTSAQRVMLEDTFSYVGPSTPTREAGLSNTLTFGNLRLYAFADYKGGHYLFNMTEQTRTATDFNNFFTNDPALLQAGADSTEYRYMITAGNNLPYLQRADFIKLREVSATITIPQRFTQRFGTESASFSLSGRNLGFLWKKYPGPDSEVNIEGNDPFTRADYMSVPMLRRWQATFSFTF
ncbi:MAG TPA: SusC/RagA family TonB-linked outer membrane protein [Longimicrobium sp.]|nr:SusC/RagA family TonB-linked outer membrane protein [Longimicrobium sp.]